MRTFVLASAAALAFAGSASATITTGSVTIGDGFTKLSVPFTESNPDNTVGANTFQTNFLYGFDESQNTTTIGDLDVDILASTNAPGTIADGTTVASHYIFFDPADITQIDGTVSFDSRIVAIIFSTDNLAASDYLANTGVTYLNPSLRGLEAGDEVTIVDEFTIRFNTFASTPGDYVRVLTEFSPGGVPTPAAFALFGLGLVALGARRKG